MATYTEQQHRDDARALILLQTPDDEITIEDRLWLAFYLAEQNT